MSEKIDIVLPCGESVEIPKSLKSDGIGKICYNHCPNGEINGYTHRCDEFDEF